MDTVRYGIIGTGMMGFEHIRNLRLLPGARVTALADPHEPSRRLGLAACGAEIEVLPDVLDNAFAVVDFENGCRALLDLCMFAEASRHEQEIAATGDAGKVECFVPESSVVVGRRAPKSVETFHVPVEPRLLEAGFHHGATYFEHAAFLDAVRSAGRPGVSALDGLRAVALGLAAERSAAERRPVELAEWDL